MARIQPTVGKRAKKRRSKSREDKLRLSLKKALIVLNELNEEDLNALGFNARLTRIEELLKKLNLRPIPAP